jgi:hypothetical protein
MTSLTGSTRVSRGSVGSARDTLWRIPSRREDARTRGRRLVAEGRLLVRRVEGREVSAICRGESGAIHELGFSRGLWFCSCPARGPCAHLYAAWLVVASPGAAVPDLLMGLVVA